MLFFLVFSSKGQRSEQGSQQEKTRKHHHTATVTGFWRGGVGSTVEPHLCLKVIRVINCFLSFIKPLPPPYFYSYSLSNRTSLPINEERERVGGWGKNFIGLNSKQTAPSYVVTLLDLTSLEPNLTYLELNLT